MMDRPFSVRRHHAGCFPASRGPGGGQRPAEDLEHLHQREMEVLRLGAAGLSNREIAAKLVIGERTVQTHFRNILRKLGVSSRTEAVLRGLREGWITLDDLPQGGSRTM